MLIKTLGEQQHTGHKKLEAGNVVELQCRTDEIENEVKAYKQKIKLLSLPTPLTMLYFPHVMTAATTKRWLGDWMRC